MQRGKKQQEGELKHQQTNRLRVPRVILHFGVSSKLVISETARGKSGPVYYFNAEHDERRIATASHETETNQHSPMTFKDYSSEDDPPLVRAAQRGDMAAFEELVGRHRNKIYARAFSIVRNEQEAIDLSQEAWVKSWRHLQKFQGESSFGTWITRIVINLCLDHLRKRKRCRLESIDAMDAESGGVERRMPVVRVNPTARLERAELRQRIDQALSQLSYEHRTVLVLREFDQLGYKEIANTMDCSLGTVMSRLYYARRKMAVLLAGLKKEPVLQYLDIRNTVDDLVPLPT